MTQTIEYNATPWNIELRIEGGDAADYPTSYLAWNNKTWANDTEGNLSHIVTTGVRIQAVLYPNGVNCGVNESGLKRLERFIKHTIKLHGPIQFKRINNFANNAPLPAAIVGLGEVLS